MECLCAQLIAGMAQPEFSTPHCQLQRRDSQPPSGAGHQMSKNRPGCIQVAPIEMMRMAIARCTGDSGLRIQRRKTGSAGGLMSGWCWAHLHPAGNVGGLTARHFQARAAAVVGYLEHARRNVRSSRRRHILRSRCIRLARGAVPADIGSGPFVVIRQSYSSIPWRKGPGPRALVNRSGVKVLTETASQQPVARPSGNCCH